MSLGFCWDCVKSVASKQDWYVTASVTLFVCEPSWGCEVYNMQTSPWQVGFLLKPSALGQLRGTALGASISYQQAIPKMAGGWRNPPDRMEPDW